MKKKMTIRRKIHDDIDIELRKVDGSHVVSLVGAETFDMPPALAMRIGEVLMEYANAAVNADAMSRAQGYRKHSA